MPPVPQFAKVFAKRAKTHPKKLPVIGGKKHWEGKRSRKSMHKIIFTETPYEEAKSAETAINESPVQQIQSGTARGKKRKLRPKIIFTETPYKEEVESAETSSVKPPCKKKRKASVTDESPKRVARNGPHQDFKLRNYTAILTDCINRLQFLNSEIIHNTLPSAKFSSILAELEKGTDLNDLVAQIQQLIKDLKEAYEMNIERLLRTQRRALNQKPQKLRFVPHPTDLSLDATFEGNKIYLVNTPFAQVFMVYAKGGRWIFPDCKSAYYFSIGRTNPKERPFGLPISYDKIASELDKLDESLKTSVYEKIKSYVLPGDMPTYRDITDEINAKSGKWVTSEIFDKSLKNIIALYAGCLAAAWLLSESGPDRIRVRGKTERSLLRSDFSEYGSFDALIKSLPQAPKGGVKATRDAISCEPSEYKTDEERIKRETAIKAIEQISPDNLSSSSDEEESDNFKKQLKEIEDTLGTLYQIRK